MIYDMRNLHEIEHALFDARNLLQVGMTHVQVSRASFSNVCHGLK